MADDKKSKPASTPKKETAAKSEGAPSKKDEGQAKDKSTSAADTSKVAGGDKPADSSSGSSRGEGQKPASKAYKDNWNTIFAKKNKK